VADLGAKWEFPAIVRGWEGWCLVGGQLFYSVMLWFGDAHFIAGRGLYSKVAFTVYTLFD
jgi:hypothetical protein